MHNPYGEAIGAGHSGHTVWRRLVVVSRGALADVRARRSAWVGSGREADDAAVLAVRRLRDAQPSGVSSMGSCADSPNISATRLRLAS